MTRYALSLLLLLATATARGQASTPSPTSDVGENVLQLVTGLVGVLAILIGALWLLKKLVVQRGHGSGLMKVIAATAVGTRERVVIVEVGSTWLVLGVAPGRVSALAEVPRQALPSSEQADAAASTANFSDWLRRLSQRK